MRTWRSPTLIGRSLAHYRITAAIGAGGMGEVYRATDTKLGRDVALKVLPAEMASNPERLERFQREAKALAALDHAGIVTVYSVEEADGVHFLTMQLVEGRSLDQLIPEGGMPLDRLLVVATAITEALAAAHEKGIVHRDLKPANVMVAESGRVKVLDFGLAKLAGVQTEEGIDSKLSTEVRTREGVVMGTVPYMSPEQVQGRTVDHRTDIFSLGVVLYEMATGHRPFAGDSSATLMSAILRDEPKAATGIRAGLPDPLARTIDRCLKKNPDERPQTARDVAAELRGTDQEWVTPAAATSPEERRRGPRRLRFIAAVAAAVAVLAVAAAGVWWWTRGAGSRWARSAALPQIARLVEKEDYYGAFLLARQAQPHLPGDPFLKRFWADHTFPFTLQTDPEGAEVLMKPYRSVDAPWDPVGRTPMKDLRLPVANLRLRIVKEGFEPLEVGSEPSGPSGRVRRFTLVKNGIAPKGMVLVPGGAHTYRSLPSIELADFWIDRYEVTNRQYKEFVDQGAYRSRDHWREPFVKDGRGLSWDEAMAFFRDTTGRLGPATWEQGTYPEGQADHPVSGVSWFEAVAYARFAAKELPTLYHWTRAAGMGHFCDILLLSNFAGRGAAPVGSHLGVSPYGAYDMAGNVKEWCWNEAGGKRYIMGAGWNEPSYMFTDADAQSPWDRSPIYGFRCAKYAVPPPPEQLKAPTW